MAERSNERMLKGGVLLGYLDFIKHEWGEDELHECLDSLDAIFSELKSNTLYSEELNEQMLTWISGKGPEYARKMGNHTVKNLKGLEYLVRFVNMKLILKQAKKNYEDAFNYGDVSVLLDEYGKHATVIMKDCNPTEESCNAWLGAFEGMIEMTRTTGDVKLIKRQFEGDKYDEFILDWK